MCACSEMTIQYLFNLHKGQKTLVALLGCMKSDGHLATLFKRKKSDHEPCQSWVFLGHALMLIPVSNRGRGKNGVTQISLFFLLSMREPRHKVSGTYRSKFLTYLSSGAQDLSHQICFSQ